MPFLQSLEGSRTRLISAPRFSNISEQNEDEDIRIHKLQSSRSRLDESPNESAHWQTQQQPKTKTFKAVDSDDDDDVVMPSRRTLDTGVSQKRLSLSSSTREVSPPSRNEDKTRSALSRSSQRENGQRPRTKGFEVVDSDDDEDDAVVMPSRRTLDTGVIHQRPSLSLSNRERSPLGGREDKVRPGLSRTSGKLTASRDVEKSEVDSVQRQGLSRSKRPLSAKKSEKDRFDRPAFDEEESKGVTGWSQSDAPAGSEDDSDGDGVVVIGRKTKTASGGKKTGGRPSLTRKSPATAGKTF